jgi:hypothetical protein
MKKNLQIQYSQILNAEMETLQQAVTSSAMIKADIHLHDEESRVPDEILGQLLGMSETWVTAVRVRDTQRSNGVDLLTITNHNNATACWKLLQQGRDVLPAAEFTCALASPFKLQVHVLAYGFTPDHEVRLNSLRGNLFNFLLYCRQQDIPTTLAHPTDFYAKKLAIGNFDLLYLLFDRFELINGQRSAFNNLLTLKWAQSFTPEKIDATEKRFGVSTADFTCLTSKSFTGGSDDHFALYTGSAGTLFDVSSYDAAMPRSQKALLALKEGKVAPFGESSELGRLSMSSLLFFFQLVNHMKMPKLQNIILMPSSSQDKVEALVLSNIIRECRENPTIKSYAEAFEGALRGCKPVEESSVAGLQDFGFIFDHLDHLAQAYPMPAGEKTHAHNLFIEKLYGEVFQLLITQVKALFHLAADKNQSLMELVLGINLSLDLRDYLALFNSEVKKDPALEPFLKPLYPLFHVVLIQVALHRSYRANYKKRDFRNSLALEVGGGIPSQGENLFLTADLGNDAQAMQFFACSPLDVLSLAGLKQQESAYDQAGDFESEIIELSVEEEIILDKHLGLSLGLVSPIKLYTLFDAGDYRHVICSANPSTALATFLLVKTFDAPASLYINKQWLSLSIYVSHSQSKMLTKVNKYLAYFYAIFDTLYFDSVEDRDQFLMAHSIELAKTAVISTSTLTQGDTCNRALESESLV